MKLLAFAYSTYNVMDVTVETAKDEFEEMTFHTGVHKDDEDYSFVSFLDKYGDREISTFGIRDGKLMVYCYLGWEARYHTEQEDE